MKIYRSLGANGEEPLRLRIKDMSVRRSQESQHRDGKLVKAPFVYAVDKIVQQDRHDILKVIRVCQN